MKLEAICNLKKKFFDTHLINVDLIKKIKGNYLKKTTNFVLDLINC